VGEELRALKLSKHDFLPSVCRLAKWLENADEDALGVALVEGESIVGAEATETLIPLIFLRWGEIDRVGALDAMSVYYHNRPDGEGGSPYQEITPFFSQWAREDPRAAMEALFTVDLPEDMMRPMHTVFDEICERDPHLAGRMVVELAASTDEKRREVSVSGFKSVMMELRKVDGTTQALAWAAQQVDPYVRENLISAFTSGLLDCGEDADALLAYRALGSAPITTDLPFVKKVAEAMGRIDSVQARTWVQSLSDGPVRKMAALAIAAQITEKQSAAEALGWLEACGKQAEFDSAYQSLAEGWPAGDPAGKYRCAQGITDRVQRSWLKYQVGFDWLRSDPAAATQALPSGMIAKLRQVTDLASAYRAEMAELFPGTDAVFSINPQAGVAAEELGE
jgi:hypothetical protein